MFGASSAALKASAIIWFLTAVAGQWLFVYYIASFYGPSTLSGEFEAWTKNEQLIDGFIAGDTAGNVFFAAHALMAAVITFGGTLQLVPQIRRYAISFHRWNGRFFILIAYLISFAGLWLVWVRGTQTSQLGNVSITLNAALIMVFAAAALFHALTRNIDIHRRWAMRTYMVVNGVWFLRVGIFGWIIVNQGPVGMGENFDGPVVYIMQFASFLLPLAVLELYLRTQDGGGPFTKFSMTALILILTVFMGVGIFGVYMFSWRTLI